jgi:signal transduction histidine kinase
MRPRASLVRRLIWLAAIWILAALIAAGVALNIFYRQTTVRRFEAGISEINDTLLASAFIGRDNAVHVPLAPANEKDRGDAPPRTLVDAAANRVGSGRYWEIAEPIPARPGEVARNLRPLARSRSLFDSDLKGPATGLGPLFEQPGRPIFYDTVGAQGEPVRAAALMSLLPGRTEPLIFIVAQDRTQIDKDAERFAWLTALSLIALGAGLVAAVFFQVRYGLAPLFMLGREIADVRKGKALRLIEHYPQEIEPLAQELNQLLDNNQEVVERQRTHVGNLAHALKTPLSVMLTEAGAAEDPLADVVRRQATLMRGQVDHHLRRARAAARAQGGSERTPVEEVIDEMAVMLERVFQARGVEIDWRVEEGLCFRGERQDLQEIIGNVLENACKYGGRKVWATAALTGDAGRMRLVVDDDGPGLPEERREEVLKRGARLDETEPGSGLGLSIVDELARAYGGGVAMADSERGGLKVVIELPAAEV